MITKRDIPRVKSKRRQVSSSSYIRLHRDFVRLDTRLRLRHLIRKFLKQYVRTDFRVQVHYSSRSLEMISSYAKYVCGPSKNRSTDLRRNLPLDTMDLPANMAKRPVHYISPSSKTYSFSNRNVVTSLDKYKKRLWKKIEIGSRHLLPIAKLEQKSLTSMWPRDGATNGGNRSCQETLLQLRNKNSGKGSERDFMNTMVKQPRRNRFTPVGNLSRETEHQLDLLTSRGGQIRKPDRKLSRLFRRFFRQDIRSKNLGDVMDRSFPILYLFARYYDPQVLADYVATELSRKRKHYPLLYTIYTILDLFPLKKVAAYRIGLTGRLNSSTKTRSFYFTRGILPIQSFHARISLATSQVRARSGTIGVKVWIYF
jgi:hypothetical protein